jgi:hypothetical protein
MIISVPERGTVEISQEVWLALSQAPEFWKLLESNILTVERRSLGQWRLRAGCYVGRSVVGEHVIEAVEKVAGSFEVLVRLMGIAGASVVNAPALRSDDDHTAALLVSLFIGAVRKYLSGHKRVAYLQRHETGALVSGRLDISGTAKLRARGMFHQAAFYRTVLTADLPINRAIYAALMQVERLARILPIDPGDVSSARALRVAMSDCLDGAMKTPRAKLAEIALTSSREPGVRGPVKDVMSLAAAVLDSAGFGGDFDWGRTVTRSWFVNLENMFERAVRKVIQASLPAFTVSGPTDRPSLFTHADDRYRANPDVVIRSGAKVVAIADAKYKDFDGWPAASDLYELIAHAAAYGAPSAFLVYPSEGDALVRGLGTSSTGCAVWAMSVPVDKFELAMQDILIRVDLLPHTQHKAA